MPRRPMQDDPRTLRKRLVELLERLDCEIPSDDVRRDVLALVPAFHLLRDLGSSLLPNEGEEAARDRILSYMRQYPGVPIAGDELMVVSGIGEWARRVRELRVQHGWRIVTGVTLNEMADEGETADMPTLTAEEYLLLDAERDVRAARRWELANTIRRNAGGVRDKILEFLKANVGEQVTGEELRYVAGGRTEWARRTRELRTEFGWPIVTKVAGRPDLPIGVYVLESCRQAPEHDRTIPDAVRREVLRRDDYQCSRCGWSHEKWNRSDPRHLEAHHVVAHKDRGANEADNLMTLCTVCHDKAHEDRG